LRIENSHGNVAFHSKLPTKLAREPKGLHLE